MDKNVTTALIIGCIITAILIFLPPALADALFKAKKSFKPHRIAIASP